MLFIFAATVSAAPLIVYHTNYSAKSLLGEQYLGTDPSGSLVVGKGTVGVLRFEPAAGQHSVMRINGQPVCAANDRLRVCHGSESPSQFRVKIKENKTANTSGYRIKLGYSGLQGMFNFSGTCVAYDGAKVGLTSCTDSDNIGQMWNIQTLDNNTPGRNPNMNNQNPLTNGQNQGSYPQSQGSYPQSQGSYLQSQSSSYAPSQSSSYPQSQLINSPNQNNYGWSNPVGKDCQGTNEWAQPSNGQTACQQGGACSIGYGTKPSAPDCYVNTNLCSRQLATSVCSRPQPALTGGMDASAYFTQQIFRNLPVGTQQQQPLQQTTTLSCIRKPSAPPCVAAY